jgi:lipid-A-disaccharide synthase-like uncharacterized protein
MINAILQWLGTLALITMYVIMSFFPEAYPLNILMGMLGGLFYLTWSYRTRNTPQIIVNAAGVLVCLMGLYRAWL